jgi:hypothetical protein
MFHREFILLKRTKPINNQLMVQFENVERGTVQIMNLSGVRLFREVEDGKFVDISVFAPEFISFVWKDWELRNLSNNKKPTIS